MLCTSKNQRVSPYWSELSWVRCDRKPKWSLRRSATPETGYLPAAGHHRPLAGTKLAYTAWWQRHIYVNNMPKVVTWKRSGRDSNARPFESGVQRAKPSSALTITPPGHMQDCSHIQPICSRWLRKHEQLYVAVSCGYNIRLLATFCGFAMLESRVWFAARLSGKGKR